VRARAASAIAIAVAFAARSADAHGLDPIGVSLREAENGAVVLRLDRPASLPDGARIDVVLEAGCEEASSVIAPTTAGRVREERHLQCVAPLGGTSLAVLGLTEAGVDAVVRAELSSGLVHRTVVSARAPRVTFAAAPSTTSTALAYFALGAKHLALGWDHLFFVIGIAWVARTAKRAALALTAFTAGHSATLSAAALGLMSFPTAWAELAIALTLVWLAAEVLRSTTDPPTVRRLAAASGTVGLVHGLGFATALADIGLPRHDVPLALFSFNLGVEAAQLALVAAAFFGVALAGRAAAIDRDRVRPWLGHALGALAAMWCIERAFTL